MPSQCRMIDLDSARQHWHPIAASSDLPPRHVFHAQLLGRELALWRADDGNVNAWENRCLHRGVRLSIGINDGTELVCQYHGWRYANRTAGCTYIPAHPADAPARTICNNTYPVEEKQGLIWCREIPGSNTDDVEPWPFSEAADTHCLKTLYALTHNATVEQTADGLMEPLSLHCDGAQTQQTLVLTRQHTYLFDVTSPSPEIKAFRLYLQPADAARTIVRGVMVTDAQQSAATTSRWLKTVGHALNQARRRIEQAASLHTLPEAWQPVIKPVSEALASVPQSSASSHQLQLRLQVTRIEEVANGIKNFRLEPISGQLPSAQPGAHVDVYLPNGMIRQYSLINGPGQTDHYSIAVKHVAHSTGGSEAMHTTLKTGDVIAASPPRNNFSLRRDAQHTYLIAGGIGITPLLSMARALHQAKLPFSLHYFAAAETDVIFKPELDSLFGTVQYHIALSAEQVQTTLREQLKTSDPHHHVYLCGPAAMLSAARKIASEQGWADSHVHFEYFKNTTETHTRSSFKVDLARSGLSLSVPAGKTLLEVLRENHVAVPSSCEQGACGTCRVSVLNGIPDHQDVYLNAAEKARGDCLMSCVSRASSDALVLDL